MDDYRLIALDMDGTLLNSHKEITPRTLEAIRRAAAAGKGVALCTGRCMAELGEYIHSLTDVQYAVCASGALVVQLHTGRVLAERCIPPEIAARIIEACRGRDVMLHMMTRGESIVQRNQAADMAHFRMGIYSGLFARITRQVDDLAAWYARNPVPVAKVNLYHATPESRDRTRARLAGLPLELADSEQTALECSAEGVTKGTGLALLCGALGLPLAEAIAVGDADNDLDALRCAGLGVAMGNANGRVCAVADAVVADCDHDGCAEAIERFLL